MATACTLRWRVPLANFAGDAYQRTVMIDLGQGRSTAEAYG
jgi:hypothetical protein